MLMQQHILKREHINTELNKIMDYPLTVVVAAMGYGKSTAARYFFNRIDANYAYLSVESEEVLPQYIWDSLTRQLIKTNPEFGNQLRAFGFPTNSSQTDKIINIFEEYTYMTNTIIVIDDYHLCHSVELDKLIERIIRVNIEGLHILILSRIIPEMSIEELVLKGFCYQIKSDLFEVTIDEIKSYFQLNGYDISEDIARQVHKISEGWVSAIYLIMQRYIEIGRVETGRSIERLIETGVMKRYSEKEVLVLKALCVLDSFSPEQAAYVTGSLATERIMKKLSYENSFIRFDEQEGVYRIHNIFNNYLKKLIEENPSDLKLKEKYKRAGEWCIKNGDILSGLNYLLKAKEYDLIMKEFEKQSITGIIDRNPNYILNLFEHIPMEIRYHYPIGYIAYIGFYTTNVDSVGGERLLSETEQYFLDLYDMSPQMKKRISGEIELIRAYIQFNDVALMKERFKKAYEILEGHSFIANKDKIITFGSPHILYLYYREKGKLSWTEERLQELFSYYNELAGGCGMGFDYQLKAEYCLETGKLEEAELYAYKAIYKARTMDQVSIIICSNFVLARVCAARGRFEEAYDIMDELNIEVENCNSPILSSELDLCAGYIGSITEENTYFAKWLCEGAIKKSAVLYQGIGFNYIVYGKYLLNNKKYIDLEMLCEEMKQIFHVFHNQFGYLHMYLLDAAAKYSIYGLEEGTIAILPALEIGRVDLMIQPFAEYGRYILPILRDIHSDQRKDEYLDRLIEITSNYMIKLESKEDSKPLNPKLTKREKEILQLIVEGKINRIIASELYIAEVTVRKNITSIYRKLKVNGRSLAVKKALQLKII